jgi:hypothetical protein
MLAPKEQRADAVEGSPSLSPQGLREAWSVPPQEWVAYNPLGQQAHEGLSSSGCSKKWGGVKGPWRPSLQVAAAAAGRTHIRTITHKDKRSAQTDGCEQQASHTTPSETPCTV